MTKIKICGVTSVADAQAIGQLAVDAIGLMFYPPSPRCLTIEAARAIGLALPPFTTRVAVFANNDADSINHILMHCPIDIIQFHGEERVDFCRQFGKPYIKSVGVRSNSDIINTANAYPDAAALLCDSYQPIVKGGAGKCFDWSLFGDTRPAMPIILAGGLTEANIGIAITAIRPYAVDLSSGVESNKGRKNILYIQGVINAVRAADHIMS